MLGGFVQCFYLFNAAYFGLHESKRTLDEIILSLRRAYIIWEADSCYAVQKEWYILRVNTEIIL